MREVSDCRLRHQPAGAMHIIAVVHAGHALLGIANLLILTGGA